MPNLAPVDWLILLLFMFFAITIGQGLRPFISSASEFFQAGRSLPAWLCGLAFCAVGLGSQAVLAMGAAGAHYGLTGFAFYSLGTIPAMVFAGLFLMPVYYGSGARTIPEFLALRFDEKTRVLSAGLFLATAIVGAAAALFATARLLKTLDVFDTLLSALHMAPQRIELLAVLLPALLVLVYVLLGGLGGTIYNLALQFFLTIVGFLPLVLLGLKQIGGWPGLKAAAAGTAFTRSWSAAGHSSAAGWALAAGMGLVLGAGFWCTDFRVLQTALAAQDAQAARRAPLLAAGAWLLLPLLLLLPGIIALGLPTPHTTEVVHMENGAIFHDITVVPAAAEAGQGLVPAQMDSAGKPVRGADGHNLLDDALATPNLLLHVLPNGLLGLGLAALLACLMGSVGAGVMASAAVFSCDLYQAHMRRNASDSHLVTVGRWAALCAVLLTLATAGAAFALHWQLDRFAVVLAHLSAPLLATILLGIFWKRTTGHGAFAGVVAGIAVAMLPTGIIAAIPALRPAWSAAMQRLPHGLELSFFAALAAFAANAAVAVAVSLCTEPKPDAAPAGTVRSLAPSAGNVLPMQPVARPLGLDARIPIGMMLSLAGATLTAFGVATRSKPEFSLHSPGIAANLWCGALLLLFGLAVLTLGRKGQLRLEKQAGNKTGAPARRGR